MEQQADSTKCDHKEFHLSAGDSFYGRGTHLFTWLIYSYILYKNIRQLINVSIRLQFAVWRSIVRAAVSSTTNDASSATSATTTTTTTGALFRWPHVHQPDDTESRVDGRRSSCLVLSCTVELLLQRYQQLKYVTQSNETRTSHTKINIINNNINFKSTSILLWSVTVIVVFCVRIVVLRIPKVTLVIQNATQVDENNNNNNGSNTKVKEMAGSKGYMYTYIHRYIWINSYDDKEIIIFEFLYRVVVELLSQIFVIAFVRRILSPSNRFAANVASRVNFRAHATIWLDGAHANKRRSRRLFDLTSQFARERNNRNNERMTNN